MTMPPTGPRGPAAASAGLARARPRALAAAGIGLGLLGIGSALSPGRFFHAWLFAWVFWLGVALGCLAILMIQHVTGGTWGLAIRRILEAAARTIPLMALLMLPLLPGMRTLYVWARPEAVAADEALRHKAAYLNVPFFLARAALYFLAWSALAYALSRWSRRQDETGEEAIVDRFQKLSAGGLLLFVLAMTFASVDWIMSLEPHWFSTIYGGLVMTGQAVSAFCFAVVVAILLSRERPLADVVTPGLLHDLGKLLFAFILVWAYFALSQFLIVWSGNLPEEIPWYLRRLAGPWGWVGLAIILLHFVLPFLLLLPRGTKRSGRALMGVAVLVFAMRMVDLYWMMAPGFPGGPRAHWMDLAAAVGLGGLWVFHFCGQLDRMPLLPRRDPYLREAMEPTHG